MDDTNEFPLLPGEYMHHGIRLQSAGFPPKWLDSLREFEVTSKDVFVCTYPKSGTTWMQEIVYLILNQDDMTKSDEKPIFERFKFIERGMPDHSQQQRLFKSHLACDLLPKQMFENSPKIIHVLRNPKDVAVSFYHMYKTFNESARFSGSWSEFLRMFITGNVYFGSWFSYVKKWLEKREDKNILFMTYEFLIENMDGSIYKIAKFLDKPMSPTTLNEIKQRVSFESMKSNVMTNNTLSKAIDQSISPFMRKGVVGDWKNYFTIAQNEAFDRVYAEEMNGKDLKQYGY